MAWSWLLGVRSALSAPPCFITSGLVLETLLRSRLQHDRPKHVLKTLGILIFWHSRRHWSLRTCSRKRGRKSLSCGNAGAERFSPGQARSHSHQKTCGQFPAPPGNSRHCWPVVSCCNRAKHALHAGLKIVESHSTHDPIRIPTRPYPLGRGRDCRGPRRSRR
jgi:hypothetical protein